MLPKELPRKKLLILGCIVLVLLLSLLIALVQQKQFSLQKPFGSPKSPPGRTGNLPPPPLAETKVPAMTFAKYNVGQIKVTVPETAKVYTLRNSFSLSYVSILAQKLGLTQSKQENRTVLFYNNREAEKQGFLKLNLDNGLYEFTSYGTHTLPASGNGLADNIRQYLTDLGLADETVNCDITYKRADIPSVSFVECHRDWQKAGLPILNFVGLFNIPDTKPLDELALAMVEENSPENKNIINVSTGQDGRERPNDYNTVTVAVDDNGNIIKINSNLKLVEATIDFTQQDFITPEKAIGQLQKGGSSSLSLIEPVEENAQWKEVFPGNTAYDLDAQVTDLILAYIENPNRNKSLNPMYLARGTAQTAKGDKIKFLQAIPALKFQLDSFAADAGLLAQNQTPYPTQFYDESLKLGTFNPEQKPGVTPDNATPCVPAENQLSPIISLGDFGLLGKWTIDAPGPQDRSGDPFSWFRSEQWYLIPANPQVLPEINQIINAFQSLNLPPGRGDNLRDLDALQKEWQKYNFCPLRVTGGSPTLIGYSATGRIYEVKVGRSLVYLSSNSDNSVYYEYQPILFRKPSSGWTIDKANLNQFAQKIAGLLELTSFEKDKLLFELKTAASKITSGKLFIGLIPQTEIDSKVPLTVLPQVPVHRYHFYVEKGDDQVSSPKVVPIIRTPDMVLEFGAVTP